MKYDKKNCQLEGRIVYCLDYPNYPYKNCPYYHVEEEFQSVGALMKFRQNQLGEKTYGK